MMAVKSHSTPALLISSLPDSLCQNPSPPSRARQWHGRKQSAQVGRKMADRRHRQQLVVVCERPNDSSPRA